MAFHPQLLPISIMASFALKILIITPLVLVPGLLVMFITPADPPQHLAAFLKKIPSRRLLLRQTLMALAAGLCLIIVWWAAVATLVNILKLLYCYKHETSLEAQ